MTRVSTPSNPNTGNTGASDKPSTEVENTHTEDKNGGGTSQAQVKESGQSGR